MKVEILVVKDYRQLSAKAAAMVAGQVIEKKNSVLGLATGSTPVGMYRELARMNAEGSVDFSSTVTFNLDEYLGLFPKHPQSYHHYMHQHLFRHVNVTPENIHIPPGQGTDMKEECRLYDEKIAAAGGIDLQVLGIGGNGHIGFNEPHDYLRVETHVVDLTEETIKANSHFIHSREDVPRQAVTMGMGPIMAARRILLLASGQSKARAIKEAVSGKITARVPASFLQLHGRTTLILDREAASLL